MSSFEILSKLKDHRNQKLISTNERHQNKPEVNIINDPYQSS